MAQFFRNSCNQSHWFGKEEPEITGETVLISADTLIAKLRIPSLTKSYVNGGFFIKPKCIFLTQLIFRDI